MTAEIRGLTIGAGSQVVSTVDLTVHDGEVVGLIGRSGSGKTTVALSLLGHLRPGLTRTAGEVRVHGHDPFTTDGRRAVRGRLVGYLGQDPASALHPTRRIGSQLREAGGGADLLDQLGLPTDRAFPRRYPGQISGGQAQRVALAMVLAREPRLLVLDEPTSGLDVALAVEVRELLRNTVRRNGIAALVVSHDQELVRALADRVVRMSGGEITADGPPAEILDPPSPPPSPPVSTATDDRLTVTGLSAHHGRHRVLDAVSLRLPAGECTAVVGPSGSGKTTLARCLVGLHRVSAGELILDGEPLGRKRSAAQRKAIALVAQNSADALNPAERVEAALARPLRLRGAHDVSGEIDELLDMVGLDGRYRTRLPGELSGGERQRINLVRALAVRPSVLVCDEITSALDGEVATGVLDALADLRARLGLSVLLITHDPRIAAKYAHRLLVLDDGALVPPTTPTATTTGTTART
ncbi:peptide/nickel transport system ATP-binding protein [Herbihabitans rhizosphaerae]|uniref:Peptide/nickel transport system ATP-binding protein n=1 Tax=Herbihabitans rhizosphaerae TaxID=1872711 RepID=A0A4Q7L9B8_9PSEU|nr:ATP-binding cassette domain-containing protein [Herbihabitans rhizosphaerae]RZS45032.1 peptide/nickel transport system ATP-binding protein [Herbihabitans rhizosphaerae]